MTANSSGCPTAWQRTAALKMAGSTLHPFGALKMVGGIVIELTHQWPW